MKKITILLLGLFILSSSFSGINVITEEVPRQYNQVEVKPQFPGGITEFMKFVMKSYQAPESEEEEGLTGTVQVSIIIDKDGNVSNVEILKDLGSAGKEIKRILAKCPKWQPGKEKGVAVPVEYTFPITIK